MNLSDIFSVFNRHQDNLAIQLLSGSIKKLPLKRVSRKIPWLRKKWNDELSQILGDIDLPDPHRGKCSPYEALPDEGVSKDKLLKQLQHMSKKESAWAKGSASGAVYHGGKDHIRFMNRVYALFSQANPLHPDLWPSIGRFEAEVVSMVANMLGSTERDSVCGTMSSGGTESILLAMKAYRDMAREERGIRNPEMIVPVTAHAAFNKAAEYFGIKKRTARADMQGVADIQHMKRLINRNTIALVASAPSFPWGCVDPVGELAEIARKKGIGLHVDACLGGFMLPFLRDRYPVPVFDFSLAGVSSLSVDTHKFGFAAKGSSVILYRSPELRKYQYFTVADWPGGMYFSPTISGSRSGAVCAQAWAAMVSTGTKGYQQAAHAVMEAADQVRAGIRQIHGLRLLGQPWWVVAFTGDGSINCYEVLEKMRQKKWSLNGLHHPPSVHLCCTLRHTAEGVVERFLRDLNQSVEWVRKNPGDSKGLAPVYGMAATVPVQGAVDDILCRYIDRLYEIRH